MSMLNYAVKMENDAEKYYQEQAVQFSDTPLQPVFEKLAEAEAKHAKLFTDFAQDQEVELKIDPNQETLFSNPPTFGDEMMRINEQAEAYRYAQQLEKDAILHYEKMLSESTDKKEKELISFVLEEERNHFTLFSNLASMLDRTEDWVEDAEFGNRPEY